MRRLLIGLLLLIVAMFSAFTQKGVDSGTKFGSGEDSIRCGKNLSVYDQDFRQKKFIEAYDSWIVAFNECPLSTVNLYTQGAIIVVAKYEKESDPTKKAEYLQLLMAVYDQRAKYFGSSTKYPASYIMGLKALDMLKYFGNDKAIRLQAYNYLKDNVLSSPQTIQPAILANYFNVTIELFKDKVLESSEVANNYSLTVSLIEKEIAQENKPAKVEALKAILANIESVFVGCGAADCNILENIYGSQYNSKKGDIEWLKNVNRIFVALNCDESPTLFNSFEEICKVEPSAIAAYGLARMCIKKNELSKAKEYFELAINLEKESILKSKYFFQLALILFNQGDLVGAKDKANRAIALNNNFGDPFLLLGKLYAAGAKSYGSNEFEKKTIYWAVVDKFIKSKQIDPKLTTEANNLIAIYSTYFPTKEELFFQGLKEGDGYQLSDWINEKTVIRFRK